MTAFTVTGYVNPVSGLLSGTYQPIPEAGVFPSANWLPQILPMKKMCPIEDASTPAISWHKCSRPNEPWETPVRVMFNTGVTFWVLRQGAPNMYITNGTFDENGKFNYGDAGTLKWDNPIAGTYNIIVDVFDQVGLVTFRWEHTCDASAFIDVSPLGTGDGTGDNPENTMSWANAYLGDQVNSPTQNKILMLHGGAYPATSYRIGSHHSRNIGAYDRNDPPIFSCRFFDHSSYRFITGIEFNDVEIATNGLIQCDANVDNLVSWKNRFINIRQDLSSPTSDNESCHTTMGLNGADFRRCVVVTENYYEDIEVAATDMFSIEEFLNSREVFVVTNPAYTTRGVNPVWYSKSGVRFAQISENTFDNPSVSAGSGGICHVQNSGTQGSYSRSVIENNFIRCNGGSAIRSNTASNGLPIDAINWVRRNDVIGGNVDAKNFDTDAGESRYTYFDSNAIQNSNSATFGITPDSEGFEVARHECVGASGVFDAEGNLTGAFVSYLYTRGSDQGIAV